MGTPLHIALRYLFAKKSHNVINIISIISAAGIAIGSMALILILSVYNGFDNSIKQIYESYKADFLVTPATGKTFEILPDKLEQLSALQGIGNYSPVLEENIFIKYGDREAIATIRGVEDEYLLHKHIQDNIVEGEAKTAHGEIPNALVGQQLARNLGLRVRFLTPVEMYFPKKEGNISVVNPLESLNTAIFYPSSIIRTDGETDANIVYAGIEDVRALTGTPEETYTQLEIYLPKNSATPIKNLKKENTRILESLQQIFPECTVKDKAGQNATLYRMMKAEKFAVYLILFFVIAIISINIFSCLSMLITDKTEDIATFLSMGATEELIRKIFHLHGFLISFTGCLIGTAVGLALAFLQQQTGIISMPGNYLVSAYPVDIQLADIIITIIVVSATGFVISLMPVKKFFKK